MSVLVKGQKIAKRYVVQRLLGSGASSDVYLVKDSELGDRTVALKLMSEDTMDKDGRYQRFVNEVSLTRDLSHPNIIRVYDIGRHDKTTVFLTMEYVDGRDLTTLVRESIKVGLSLEEAIWIIAQVANGLQFAHRNGVIHRDLKPDNVLVSAGGKVRITDFGLARWSDSNKRLTKQWEIVGTPLYMAPEQFEGADVDARADIYALGLVAFEILTGQRAFDSRSYEEVIRKHMEEPIADVRKIRKAVPDWLAEIINKCAQKRPSARFQSCKEIIKLIERNHSRSILKSDSNASLSKRISQVSKKPAPKVSSNRQSKLRPQLIPQHYVQFPEDDYGDGASFIVKVMVIFFTSSMAAIIYLSDMTIFSGGAGRSAAVTTTHKSQEIKNVVSFDTAEMKLVWPDGSQPTGSVPSYKLDSLTLTAKLDGVKLKGIELSAEELHQSLVIEVKSKTLVKRFDSDAITLNRPSKVWQIVVEMTDIKDSLSASGAYHFTLRLGDTELTSSTLEVLLVKLRS